LCGEDGKHRMDEITAQYLPRIRSILPGLQIDEISHNAEGLVNEVFIVNQAVVVRFAKNERACAILQAEVSLLERIRPQLAVAIPDPFFISSDVIAYPLLGGVSYTRRLMMRLNVNERQSTAEQLGGFLSTLHSLPLDERVVTSPAPVRYEDWLDIRSKVEQKIYPLLMAHQREWAQELFDGMLAEPGQFDYRPCLIHGDLSPYHILFAPAHNRIHAVIDFGVAGRGDPALDTGCLLQVYGERFVTQMLAAYPGAAQHLPRARFYAQAIELEWILNGLNTGQAFWFTAHLGGARELNDHE